MMRVRAAAMNDLKAIKALAEGAQWTPRWSETLWSGLFEQNASVRHIVRVAEDGEAVLGFAVASAVLDLAEIESIAVDESRRRQGIGRLLVESIQQEAQAAACSRLQLEVHEHNAAALALYAAAGMAVEGRRERYYSGECAAILMGQSWPLG